MWKELLKITSVITLSGIKFVGGPPLAFAYKFTYLEIIIFNTLGGLLGVLCIVYLSDYISKLTRRFRIQQKRRKRKIFNKRNRMLVRFKSRFGLIGIAAVTPVLLSIPIGTFIASRFIHNKRKIVLYMLLSIIFWSVFLTSIIKFSSAN